MKDSGVAGGSTDYDDLMHQCIDTIRNAGKTVGTFADNPEIAKQWIDAGIGYIAVVLDQPKLDGLRRTLRTQRRGDAENFHSANLPWQTTSGLSNQL